MKTSALLSMTIWLLAQPTIAFADQQAPQAHKHWFGHHRKAEDAAAAAQSCFECGTRLEDRDEHRKAIADFNKAIELQPQKPEFYLHRGTSYFGVSDFKHAIADFTQAIALNSNEADAYFRRGNAYAADRRLEDALSDFNQAIKLDGDKHPLYYLKRADVQSELGNHGDAIADISKAISIRTEEGPYLLNRGLEYQASGQLQKSIDDLSTCIDRHPSSPVAYKNRGISKAKLGDNAGAMLDFQHSAELYKQEGDRHGEAEVGRLMKKLSPVAVEKTPQ